MKKILYVPMFTVQDKNKDLYICDVCENLKIMKYIIKELSNRIENYKKEIIFRILLPCQGDFLDIDNYINEFKNLSNNFNNLKLEWDFIPYSYPKNNVHQRFNFNFEILKNIISLFEPDIIINNVDTTSKELKIICNDLGLKNTKVYTFFHYIDLPSKRLNDNTHSYFIRQIESLIFSDKSIVLSYINRKLFFNESIDVIKAIYPSIDEEDILEKLEVWPFIFSSNELEKEFNRITKDVGVIGEEFIPRIIFPNRLSKNNYTNHEAFIYAVNKLADEGYNFKVIMTNPTKQISDDWLEKNVKNIIFPFGKKRLSRNEYLECILRSNIAVALFREVHGGTSIRECIFGGCMPVIPAINDYAKLFLEIYKYVNKTNKNTSIFKIIPRTEETNFSKEGVYKTLKYYLDNFQNLYTNFWINFDKIKKGLCEFESIEHNFWKFEKLIFLE